MFTSMLGTSQAQPGLVQPGYFSKGIAVWEGPFSPGQLQIDAKAKASILKHGFATVPLAVASQMSAADSSWWVMH